MVRRTTIELDEDLLAEAKRALGTKTIRATVEQALRVAADTGNRAHGRRAAGQRRYLERFSSRVDLEVLGSEEMWR